MTNNLPANTVLVVGDHITDAKAHQIVRDFAVLPPVYQVLRFSPSYWLIDWIDKAKGAWQLKQSRLFDLSGSVRYMAGLPWIGEPQLYLRTNTPLIWLTDSISGVDTVDQIDRPYLAARLVQGFVSNHHQRNVVALIIEEAVFNSENGELMLTALRHEQHSEGLDDAVQIHIVKPDMAVEVAYQV